MTSWQLAVYSWQLKKHSHSFVSCSCAAVSNVRKQPTRSRHYSRKINVQRRFDFAKADALVEMAHANGLTVNGHTLVWHQQCLADQYARLFDLFLKHRDKIARITFWGLHDGRSWLNYWPSTRTNHPLLWDRSLQPKPALSAVLRVASRNR